MQAIIFAAALAALSLLNLLLIATIFSESFKLWPTPGKGSWQNYVFWPLFRGGLGLTLLLAVIEGWPKLDLAHWPQLAAGLPMIAAGFGFLIYGYFDLGIENTYGSEDGLVTDGLYRYSRNPQYVASIIGFAGIAIAVQSVGVVILCALAVLVYVLMPFTEEPWLAKTYGDAFQRYRAATPRFLGLQPFLRKRPEPLFKRH